MQDSIVSNTPHLSPPQDTVQNLTWQCPNNHQLPCPVCAVGGGRWLMDQPFYANMLPISGYSTTHLLAKHLSISGYSTTHLLTKHLSISGYSTTHLLAKHLPISGYSTTHLLAKHLSISDYSTTHLLAKHLPISGIAIQPSWMLSIPRMSSKVAVGLGRYISHNNR